MGGEDLYTVALNIKLMGHESVLRNGFLGRNYLAGRYDNPIHTGFLAPIDCLKILAHGCHRNLVPKKLRGIDSNGLSFFRGKNAPSVEFRVSRKNPWRSRNETEFREIKNFYRTANISYITGQLEFFIN